MVKVFGKNIALPRFGVNVVNGGWFEKQTRKAFDECDVDKDGKLDTKEVYIALLKVYDLVNRKLPCHVKVPKMVDIDSLMAKFDTSGNKHLEFPEFLKCSKALIATRKHWRDSLFLKIGLAVLLKTVAFPFVGGLLKVGAHNASNSLFGVSHVEKVPNSAFAFVAEQAAKQVM